MGSKKIMVFGLVFLVVFLVPMFAFGGKTIKKTIKNPTNKPANDLNVCTEGPPDSPNNNTRNYGGFVPKTISPADRKCAYWPSGSGNVPAYGTVTVTVNTKSGKAKFDDKKTCLTRNDTMLTVIPCTCGGPNCPLQCCECLWLVDAHNTQHFGLDGSGGGGHTLTITNNEEVSIIYTDVQVWLENDNSIGQVDSLDTFDLPTGFLSPMVPPVIEIPAHSDTTFELEPYTGGYDLFLANEYSTCNPGATGPLASAEVPTAPIPTLTTIALGALILLVIALGVYLIARRKRVQDTA